MKSFILFGCFLTYGIVAVSAQRSPFKIDVHSHFIPDFYLQELEDAGHTPGPEGIPGMPVRLCPTTDGGTC